jgi:hypothetical protein
MLEDIEDDGRMVIKNVTDIFSFPAYWYNCERGVNLWIYCKPTFSEEGTAPSSGHV